MQQYDQVDAAVHQRRGPAQHRLGVAALIEVGDEHQVGLGRIGDVGLAIGQHSGEPEQHAGAIGHSGHDGEQRHGGMMTYQRGTGTRHNERLHG